MPGNYRQKFKPNLKYLPNTPAIKPFKNVGLYGLNGSNGLGFEPDHEPLKTANFNGLLFKPDPSRALSGANRLILLHSLCCREQMFRVL